MNTGVSLDDCPLSTDMKDSSGASCDIPSVGELECVLYGGKKSCNHVDEVWPNLFLGDMSMAHDRYGLWKLGITHVLNAAHGKMCCQGSHDFYGTTVDYYGVPANDLPTFDLSPYFYPSAHYIHETLNIPNGSSSPDGFYIDIRIFSTTLCNLMQSTSSLSPAKIFVHCAVGVSRSASLVLAYLMIYHHFSLMDAIKRVKENRWIFPNRGFLKQLRQLDETLQREKSID